MALPRRLYVGAAALCLAILSHALSAEAQEALQVPAIPDYLTLDEALRLFRTRGVDLLLADQAIQSATSAATTADQRKNPTLSVLAGPTFNQNTTPPCSGCSRISRSYGISDNGAALDALAGKRGLRVRQALSILAAARAHRADVERLLVGQVKTAYVEVALANQGLLFARETQKSLDDTLELTQRRYPSVISEAELARVETQKLEGDQQVAIALQKLRTNRTNLALLLGARSRVPDFTVDRSWLDFRVPRMLTTIDEASFLRDALLRRPDMSAAVHALHGALRNRELAERQRFPDVTLSMQVNGTGFGEQAASPTTLVLGAGANLPIFYQQQGEIRRAGAQVDALSLSHAKREALIAADVAGALATFQMTRLLVERMEKELLPRVATARDILAVQFRSGKAPLMDYLDAQRTYIASRIEYYDDLEAYWGSVFAVEQAIGTDVTP